MSKRDATYHQVIHFVWTEGDVTSQQVFEALPELFSSEEEALEVLELLVQDTVATVEDGLYNVIA